LQKETIESELIFNITANQTRGVLLENQVPQEIYCESKEHPDLVGKIFKGKVIRLLPNIKAAFIDIGIDKAAFMPFSKIPDDNDGYLTIPEIQRHNLIEGSNHLVQIVKNPVGDKGAKVTTLLTLASRYFVYLINDKGIGVSSKIKNDKERKKLNNLVSDFIIKNDLSHGVIVRTMAENVSNDILLANLERLCQRWDYIQKKSKSTKSGNCVYEDLPLPARVYRDSPARTVKNIRVDSESSLQMLNKYIIDFFPDSQTNIECYDAREPIFQ
jgi:ribonuclease G